jgi:restriction system protein
MARQKTSPLEDLISLTSRLSWWVCILLAIVSYFVLHMIASRPAMTIAGPGQTGDAVTKGIVTTLAMFGQYLLPFAFGIAGLLSGMNSIRQRKPYDNVESRSDAAALNEMSWQDFERLVGEYYRRNGFLVTREGGNGSDGGIDLVLRKDKEMYLVQCKQWKAYKVGAQSVREFYGVMASRGAVGGYFVTSGIYTEDAQTFVRGLNIELVDGQKLRRMIDTARKKPVGSAIQIESQQTVIAPTCPKCGAEMKKRIARQGKNAGKEFWGCIGFPKCNGTRPL